MPIHATHRPDLLRISFTAPVAAGDRHEAEIVCYLQATDAGLKILYAHHLFRSRTSKLGSFEENSKIRRDLSGAMIATILDGVMYELWSSIARTVEPLSGDVGQPVDQIIPLKDKPV